MKPVVLSRDIEFMVCAYSDIKFAYKSILGSLENLQKGFSVFKNHLPNYYEMHLDDIKLRINYNIDRIEKEVVLLNMCTDIGKDSKTFFSLHEKQLKAHRIQSVKCIEHFTRIGMGARNELNEMNKNRTFYQKCLQFVLKNQ